MNETAPTAPPIAHLPQTGFLRQSQIIPLLIPISSASFWRMVKDGRFPKPVKLGPKVTAWRAEDVRAWIACPGAAATEQ